MNSSLENKFLNSTERVNSFGFWLALFILFIGIDQSTKFLAVRSGLDIFQNYYFAFSLPLPVVLMYSVYVLALGLILRHLIKVWSDIDSKIKIAWLLILAGGVSNIIERIILGYVRDFIPITTAIFNSADFMIILGVLIILLTGVKEKK